MNDISLLHIALLYLAVSVSSLNTWMLSLLR